MNPNPELESDCYYLPVQYHTGPSFNTGTENTIQVSKFKRIGFENKMADFDGGESVSAYSIINLYYFVSEVF